MGTSRTGKADNPAATKALSEAEAAFKAADKALTAWRSRDVPEEDRRKPRPRCSGHCARSVAEAP